MWNDDDANGNEEQGYNVPVLYVDGQMADYDIADENLERVQVSFPAKENGEQLASDAAAPLGWCNSAAITLDRDEDAVTLSISVGDPRGAFAVTVRRLPDGRLIMHFPTPNSTYLHKPLRLDHEGTYVIGESDEAPEDPDDDEQQ